MILTVTLNPAIDKTCMTDMLKTGQVNRMESLENYPGGKGINVGRILCEFAIPVTATGFLGGYTGKWIEERVRELGIECSFVRIEGETRCSLNVIDKAGVTEILEPGPAVSAMERLVFLSKYRELAGKSDLIILSGSIAPGLPDSIYVELTDIARDCGKRVILDASGKALAAGIGEGPYLVKPNIHELEYIAGCSCQTQKQLLSAARGLFQEGTEYVAVSAGADGMYLLSRTRQLFAKAPKVNAVNTVGCGDSACASFAMSVLKGESMELMLQRAVALSAASATTRESAGVAQALARELTEKIDIEQVG